MTHELRGSDPSAGTTEIQPWSTQAPEERQKAFINSSQTPGPVTSPSKEEAAKEGWESAGLVPGRWCVDAGAAAQPIQQPFLFGVLAGAGAVLVLEGSQALAVFHAGCSQLLYGNYSVAHVGVGQLPAANLSRLKIPYSCSMA